MSDIVGRLFDAIYDGAEELIKKLQRPLIERQIKRKLQSAYDDAAGKINEAQLAISNHRKQLDKYDVNTILKQKSIIEECEKLQDLIQKEYKDLFAEELK